jgi:hypothetical protein
MVAGGVAAWVSVDWAASASAHRPQVQCRDRDGREGRGSTSSKGTLVLLLRSHCAADLQQEANRPASCQHVYRVSQALFIYLLPYQQAAVNSLASVELGALHRWTNGSH